MVIGNITNRMYPLVRPLTIPDIVEQHWTQLIENALRLLAAVITDPTTGVVVVEIVQEVMDP